MIQTILLTVLFTILGVGVVISLVWLMATSWKTKKMSNANSDDIRNLYTNLSNEVSEIYKNYDEKFKSIDNDLNNRIIGVYNDMDKRFVDVYRNYDSQIKDVYSKMDRRFDKYMRKDNPPMTLYVPPVENNSVENGGDKSWNLTPSSPSYSGDFASQEAENEWRKQNPTK
jgi:hypothetical protein